jgi:hypothetical protein
MVDTRGPSTVEKFLTRTETRWIGVGLVPHGNEPIFLIVDAIPEYFDGTFRTGVYNNDCSVG